MSHEFESGAVYKEAAWHGLAKVVDHVLTAKEMIEAAGLNWTVEKVPVFSQNSQGVFIEAPEFRGMRRSTDGKMISILGAGYEPVQNSEAFEFFDAVVATKEAKYHTAGSLMGGRKVWMLAKLDGTHISVRGDDIDKYLLLLNGHDGMTATKMFFTPVRVVCNNTLMAAESRANRANMFYSRHSGNIKDRMEADRQIIGISLKFYDTFLEGANRLAVLQLPPAELPKLLVAAFGTSGAHRVEDVVAAELSKRKEEQFATITRLFEGAGKGLDRPEIKGTMWAAYNAVVEYQDYWKEYKGKNPEDTRLSNTWFSTGAAVKQNAWNYLHQLAK